MAGEVLWDHRHGIRPPGNDRQEGKKTAPRRCLGYTSAISLLKRWLVGTHQGTVGHKHLDYYRDEFAFIQTEQVEQPWEACLPSGAAGCS